MPPRPCDWMHRPPPATCQVLPASRPTGGLRRPAQGRRQPTQRGRARARCGPRWAPGAGCPGRPSGQGRP
eukprot:6505289-Alexandrium_andersonii.AAC.1